MPIWLKNWLESQKQTRKFHPSWIVMVVIITIVVGSIIWVLAVLVAKSEAHPMPAPEFNAAPAMIEQVPLPAHPEPKTIRIDFPRGAERHSVSGHPIKKT